MSEQPFELPPTRRYDREGVIRDLEANAESGALSKKRLQLACLFSDSLAKRLLGKEAVKAPRPFDAWWERLGPRFQEPEVCVRALVAATQAVLGHGGSRGVRAASEAATLWADAPTPAHAKAARDAALGIVNDFAKARRDPYGKHYAEDYAGILALHAAWSAGILPQLSFDQGEWCRMLRRAMDANGVTSAKIKRALKPALLPWALGLGEGLWKLYKSKPKKAKKKKA